MRWSIRLPHALMNSTMKRETKMTEQETKIIHKGNCLECSYYKCCPRMQGINQCKNIIETLTPQKDIGKLSG